MTVDPSAARRLALGTVQFGVPYGIANVAGQVSPEAAGAMLAIAAEAGVDTLDTAIGYGTSEAVLGRLGVNGFRVVSKLPSMAMVAGDVAAWVDGEITGSLGRLCIPRLAALMLHRPMELLGPGGPALLDALRAAKDAGKAEKIGVSVYSPEELDALSGLDFDIVQAPFNLLDRRLETSGWLERLKARGVEVHTRSAFLQGLLLMPRAKVSAKFTPWRGLFDQWHDWLCATAVAPLAACLRFVLSHPGIDRAVVGSDGPLQLRQIVEAAASADLWPDIVSDDERLLNPARWADL